tara:strand:- start:51 stop:152 length:102 start_codon:yes stop_codon:yes gene_type:complete
MYIAAIAYDRFTQLFTTAALQSSESSLLMAGSI